MSRGQKGTKGVATLIKTINDNPIPNNTDFTPSVLKLSAMGFSGARAVLDLLNASDYTTRKHAQRVVEVVTMRRHGWTMGQGYPNFEAQHKVEGIFKTNGNYQADDPPRKRKRSIEKWRQWIEAQDE